MTTGKTIVFTICTFVSKVITSLVMERKDEKNTFLLKRAEPDSSSYARDIAEKYGITYEQMKENSNQ